MIVNETTIHSITDIFKLPREILSGHEDLYTDSPSIRLLLSKN